MYVAISPIEVPVTLTSPLVGALGYEHRAKSQETTCTSISPIVGLVELGQKAKIGTGICGSQNNICSMNEALLPP